VDQRNTLDELRSRIAEGRYEVDPLVVADAIIRHRSSLAAAKRSEARHVDGSRRRRLAAIRRAAHRRSRGASQRLAA
jgi:hypothetical protein